MLGGGDARTDRAFERLYRRHVREVYRYASAVLGNPADAEDVTQTAFLNAYRAFQSGTRPDEPLNWLIAITHNVCRQRFREGSRRPREVGLDREFAFEPSAEEGFQREDILRAFSQLSLNQRAALAMRELEGRSYAEIGSVLGMTKAAVETLIFRARRSFREQLEGSLTCNEAERAISLQLDGVLPRAERGSLRAHLRGCPECASLARRYRAQRSAFKGIGLVPLPPSLAGGFGLTSGAAVGTAIGVKAVAFGTAALVAAGVGTEVAITRTHAKPTPAPVKSLRATLAPAEQSPAAVLASASVALLAQPAATNTPLRTLPAKAKATSRASSSPPAHVASGPPAPAAVAQSIARVATALAVQQADAPKRDTTAARQQPQLSGGGHSADGGPRGLAVDHGHQQSGQAAEVHGSSGVARDHPAHPTQPTHPDHPAHPDNPGQGQGQEQGQGQGGQTATPTPDPPTDAPTVTDVTVPTVPDPPPAAPTPPGNGTPPAEPPGQAKSPKPPKPGGNPHGSLLPRL
jgi:RNA polymerase sigma-70 factor (ECF subfamily)